MATTAMRLDAASSAHQSDASSQTIIWLALGALLGVTYSLGTEKFISAMRHRHVFVRNAVLWLSALTWLVAAAALAWVASQIYNQTDGLEGFDRVLGVLIPFVVRADLIVDWAKRVAWALLNMTAWTQSAVQLRRLFARALAMQHVVAVDDEVLFMMRTRADRHADLIEAEEKVWTQDAESLVNVSEMVQHFEKLARIAMYAFGGLIGAVPGCVVWVLYAVYHGFMSFRNSFFLSGTLYWISILLAPLGAVILILASTGLLCGVVTLSVVGTVIQFSVYWSTRIVFSMVRIMVSQQWAGFPDIVKPHTISSINHDPPGGNAHSYAVRPIRHPEEAGAAVSLMGALLPTELEFTLASWDGFHLVDGTVEVLPSAIPQKILSLTGFDMTSNEAMDDMSRHLSGMRVSKCAPTPDSSDNRSSIRVFDDGSVQAHSPGASERDIALENETTLILLARLGLDLRVKSPRKRRLSTYYALGMLVQLQVESGGNAWRLHVVPKISDEQFERRISRLNSFIADEAQIAVQELSQRLRGSSKYKVVPTGAPSSAMIPVTFWLRSVVLSFLETPVDSDGGKMRKIEQFV